MGVGHQPGRPEPDAAVRVTARVTPYRGGMPSETARITLVVRQGCHLCEQAREVVVDVADELGVGWQQVDVDADAELLARYGEEVPVVLVDGARHAVVRVDPARLRQALAPSGERRRRWLQARASRLDR